MISLASINTLAYSVSVVALIELAHRKLIKKAWKSTHCFLSFYPSELIFNVIYITPSIIIYRVYGDFTIFTKYKSRGTQVEEELGWAIYSCTTNTKHLLQVGWAGFSRVHACLREYNTTFNVPLILYLVLYNSLVYEKLFSKPYKWQWRDYLALVFLQFSLSPMFLSLFV